MVEALILSISVLFCYLVFGFMLVWFLFLISYCVASQLKDVEKFRGYECGFDSFLNTKMLQIIYFHLIAILFTVFDIELVFLVPGLVCFLFLSVHGVYSLLFFLYCLIFGFLLEWRVGLLDTL